MKKTSEEFLEWLRVSEGDLIKIEGYEKLFVIEIDMHGGVWLKYDKDYFPIYSLVGIQYTIINPKDIKEVQP